MKETTLKRSLLALVVLVFATTALADAGQLAEPTFPLGERLPSYNAKDVPDSLREPSGDLRLQDALALALLHNPNLAAFSWGLRAGEAARLQAGAWPNPEIGFEYENFGGSEAFAGGRAAEATLVLSQLVPLGGKRGKKTDIARLDRRLAGWDYEIARIRTHTTTTTAFIEVLAAQEQVALADTLVEIARSIEEAVSERVDAGGALVLEKNRARAATEISRIESRLSERRLAVARRELATMWGSREPRFSRALGAMEWVDEEVPLLEALLGLVDRHPEVARWTTELELRYARGRAIQAERVPDLNLEVGVRRHNADDDTAFLLGVSAPLPLWDGKRGAAREAGYLAEKAGHERRAAGTDIRRRIAVTYEHLASAHEEITRLRDHVLPEAEAAASSSEDAYRAGALQLTDVLDIQRTFFHLRLRYVDALARYHRSLAELEGLIGEPVHGIRPGKDTSGTEEDR